MPPEVPELSKNDILSFRRPNVAIQEGRAAWSDKQSSPIIRRTSTACRLLQQLNHVIPRHTHQIRRIDLMILAVKQPSWRTVCLPPERLAYVVLLRNPSLDRNRSTLVVDSKEHCSQNVEDEPDANQQTSPSLWYIDRGQQKRDRR